MNQNEKNLFFELCCFRSDNREQIYNYVQRGYATPELLGHLFWNRMIGVACHNLQQSGGINILNREFRSAMLEQVDRNIQKNHSYFQCVQYLSNVLSPFESHYAMLKGAVLCGIYPEGCRTANDIDLLVPNESISKIGHLLENEGFTQGYLRGNLFRPASRKEIIYSRMMRGETVPYVKKVNLPGMPYLEVDVNFSADYKNSSGSVEKALIERAETVQINDLSVRTLCKIHFLIHLCLHLYKEATTISWVKMKRDMSLYKYLDICFLLEKLSLHEELDFIQECRKLNTNVPCFFAISCAKDLLGGNHAVYTRLIDALHPGDDLCLHTVVDPENDKTLTYRDTDIVQRFWKRDRQILLQENQ